MAAALGAVVAASTVSRPRIVNYLVYDASCWSSRLRRFEGVRPRLVEIRDTGCGQDEDPEETSGVSEIPPEEQHARA